MKFALLRLSRAACCFVLAGALLAGCSALPTPDTPAKEATTSSTLYYDSSRLEDGRLRLIYPYSGSGATVLRGGTVLYEGSSADSVQLLSDELTGDSQYYMISRSTPGTEERSSTLYDAEGSTVMTFDRAVIASVSGGLLVVWDADSLAGYAAWPAHLQVFDLATGAQLPVPEQATSCSVLDTDGQRLVFNCYALPEGLTNAYDDTEQPLHQYVLVTDREGNTLLREDGCEASTLYAADNTLPGWVQLNWRTADWSLDHAVLYNTLTGQQLTGGSISNCSGGSVAIQNDDGSYTLYDLNDGQATEIGQFASGVYYYTPACAVLFSDSEETPYTLVDLVTGQQTALQRDSYAYESHTMAVLTADNAVRVYDTGTGALLTDVDAQPVEGADHVSVTALSDGYALLQYDDAAYNTLACQTYGAEGLLWSSAGAPEQYSYASLLTQTADGPVLSAQINSTDNSVLYDVLDVKGNVLLRHIGSCYRSNDYPDDCFIARQGFDYGLMDSNGQWLYRTSIFSSPSDDSGGSYLY